MDGNGTERPAGWPERKEIEGGEEEELGSRESEVGRKKERKSVKGRRGMGKVPLAGFPQEIL